MHDKIVAVAGGTGFIGRAVARRLAAAGLKVRVLTRDPESRRKILTGVSLDYIRADVTEPRSLERALEGIESVINAVQFDGYPVENPRRGLTFERVDYLGTLALLAAARRTGVEHFIYVSGAAADERSPHPGFRAKGKAERAVRESGIGFTIFRPSLVYGPEDKVVNNFARLLRFAPLFPVPGTGRQTLQPVLVDDLARCVELALSGRGRDRSFDVGGPRLMTFDDLIRLVMTLTGRRRPLLHVPARLMRAVGALAERLPGAMLSRDAVEFVTADNPCDIGPLVKEFEIELTEARSGMAYLAREN